ncbi:MAG: hypothetical protein IT462_10780 [Planctomycetes bacterium]|nr:hypothetical protein [Planctomycetota bacterium]
MTSLPTYVSENKFTSAGALIGVAVCFAVGFAGWPYQMAITAMTNPEGPGFIALILGILIGILVGKLMCRLGCRGGRNVMWFAVAAGALALVVGHVQAYVAFRQGILQTDFETDGEREFVLEQYGFFDYINWRVESGWVTTSTELKGPNKGKVTTTEYKGANVYFLWLGEAFLILAPAAFIALYLGRQTRCQKCHKQMWSRQLGTVQPVDPRVLKAAEHAGDLQTLLYPQQVSARGDSRMVYILYSCPACGQSAYVSGDLRWTEGNKLMSQTLLDRAILPPETLTQLTTRLAVFAEVDATRRSVAQPAAWSPSPPPLNAPMLPPAPPAPIMPKPRDRAPWE